MIREISPSMYSTMNIIILVTIMRAIVKYSIHVYHNEQKQPSSELESYSDMCNDIFDLSGNSCGHSGVQFLRWSGQDDNQNVYFSKISIDMHQAYQCLE